MCVRVVNMAGVDLNIFTFDYDLTFAAVLMNADGTIYHRYGSRDSGPAASRLSMASFVRVLRESLKDHEIYQAKPRPPEPKEKRTADEIPSLARKIEERKRTGKHAECIHCHMVNGERDETARESGKFLRDEVLGRWPLPEKVGLTLDIDDPALVKRVAAGSPAASAGVKPGDRLVRAGEQRIRTQTDLQWILDSTPNASATIQLETIREGDMVMLPKLELRPGWKIADPWELAWRSSMWGLRPQPGFGGQPIDGEEREKLGLGASVFALKVGYIVDWGNEARFGENVHKAGIRKGDIVLSVAGSKDFKSELHFQSWFRLTRKSGEKVQIELLRDGKPTQVELPVIE